MFALERSILLIISETQINICLLDEEYFENKIFFLQNNNFQNYLFLLIFVKKLKFYFFGKIIYLLFFCKNCFIYFFQK